MNSYEFFFGTILERQCVRCAEQIGFDQPYRSSIRDGQFVGVEHARCSMHDENADAQVSSSQAKQE